MGAVGPIRRVGPFQNSHHCQHSVLGPGRRGKLNRHWQVGTVLIAAQRGLEDGIATRWPAVLFAGAHGSNGYHAGRIAQKVVQQRVAAAQTQVATTAVTISG